MQVLEDSNVEGAIFSKAESGVCGRLEDCLLTGSSGRHYMSDVNLGSAGISRNPFFKLISTEALTCFDVATHWRPATLDYPGMGYTNAKPCTLSESGPYFEPIRALQWRLNTEYE